MINTKKLFLFAIMFSFLFSQGKDLNSAKVKLSEHYEKLETLRFQKSMQQIENPLEIKFLKKEIAQLKTLLNEFKLGLRGDNTSND